MYLEKYIILLKVLFLFLLSYDIKFLKAINFNTSLITVDYFQKLTIKGAGNNYFSATMELSV